jgi:hypothetical protein
MKVVVHSAKALFRGAKADYLSRILGPKARQFA